MNIARRIKFVALAAVASLGLALAGCSSTDAVNPEKPWTPAQAGVAAPDPFPTIPVTPPPPQVASNGSAPVMTLPDTLPTLDPQTGALMASPAFPPGISVLQVRDMVEVTFSDVTPPPPQFRGRIRDDGKIALPYNVTVLAAGKTTGELQDIIRTNYVPGIYHYLTVTVRTEDQVYYVGGEVRNPSRQLYATKMTVTRAIDTAGGFTEFAKKSKIRLQRVNGKEFTIDYDKAVKNQKNDLEVFPGDRIYVPAKIL